MPSYNPQKIEKKWQRIWQKQRFWQAEDFSKKPKFYLLVEFPYPSGEGLHVGHCRSYIALDIIARKMRMQGFNVLFPMGWDAFGLPTENYAIKTGVQPEDATQKNTANFKHQQKMLGLSFDWTREILTTDPRYYKWTQWIFLQLFKHGLAYKAKIPINWCPSCKIGLANEEVVEGRCERCGEKVTKKEKEQWMLKITKYASRLIDDLQKVDYPEKVKALQKDWVGRSEGVEVEFPIAKLKSSIKVFTTRPDTIFGVTAIVLAPEHPLATKLINNHYKKQIEKYIETTRAKSEFERTKLEKEKTGVFTGAFCFNPANNEKVPIWLADYVLSTYGGGAVMLVPAHDKRDYQFAKRYNLPIREVIAGGNIAQEAYVGEGILVNSGQFNGLNSKEAALKITQWLATQGKAKKKVQYKLHDWVFSRQRYWGEPIPMIKCQKCGWVPVPEKDLPVELPRVKEYKPTKTGESPLADVKEWVETRCVKCKGRARRETDVMPNWAGSNWYFLRYCDPDNKKKLADEKKLKYWMPVDWYNGGMEHTTLHLLYSRFIYKFLWDIGAVPKCLGPEPYKKRTSHGVILAEGGIKMSKSKGNTINPQDVVSQYGTDALRIYEMFMGPFDQAIAWSAQGLRGAQRFLRRVWDLAFFSMQNKKSSHDLLKAAHKLNQKIDSDLEKTKFNTAVSSLMEFLNLAEEHRQDFGRDALERFLLLLAPFCPHLAEELWQKIYPQKYEDREYSIFQESWPKPQSKFMVEKAVLFLIEINGKLRDRIELAKDSPEETVKEIALKQPKIKKWLAKQKIKKTIFVSNRLLNIVTE